MRVSIILYNLGLGGVAHVAAYLASGFAERGIELNCWYAPKVARVKTN